MQKTILFTRDGDIARLVLNKPERHNSLGKQELLAIQGFLKRMSGADTPRVLVISAAAGKTFCAGAALDELNSGEISADLFQQTTDQIAELQIPTIAVINGNAFGGGVELALSCDYRIGVRGAYIKVPAAEIGLCYPVSGIQRFVQRLGVSAAKRLLMAAEKLHSDEMLSLGFLDYLVEPDQIDQQAERLAQKLASLAPLSVQGMKSIIQAEAAAKLDVDSARQLYQSCLDSADLQEGFAAQREKRRANFCGA
ncbi:enoyl-CoA hydratase/isomerase family protein [Parahaliea sp. F7430]|uniref:Enoyl-CoA hydratase/isomerase family protein n=1 Tax=Sediminihaliea albiluteola TaxID=2758564 RepID=A0A7W2YKY9_9GAMM|nr:enoyl-CoA hydratase/isomerase family protein [Sediminihaliea albiluteola]MBA6414229.1 enoyl-CoA hydratase/isomerase family protein [Sediminihaliea albiluteola]